MNFYNDNEPSSVRWLRGLTAARLIPHGVIDERSIHAIDPADLARFTQCHFFAGIGGWPRALALAGVPSDAPVWTGSCPCQPFSVAGKGLGESDPRHLWPEFARLIGQRLYWGAVRLGDSQSHDQQRLPDAQLTRLEGHPRHEHDRDEPGRLAALTAGHAAACGYPLNAWSATRWHPCTDGKARRVPLEPALFPLAHGLPGRVGLLRGAGNAIVPQLAALFITAFHGFRLPPPKS